MTLKLHTTTRHFCLYCKNELYSDQELELQAHQQCLEEMKVFENEHSLKTFFKAPDAKFLSDLYSMLNEPFIRTDFNGKRPLTLIGQILHHHL